MKVKLQFDAKTIKEFLLGNVEKIGLAIVLAAFAYIVYDGLRGTQPYGKTPQKLLDDCNAASARVSGTKPDGWPEKKEEKPVLQDYVVKAVQSHTPIQLEPYVGSDGALCAWSPDLFPNKRKRDTPLLYPAEKLQVWADRGTFHAAFGGMPTPDPSKPDPTKPAEGDKGAGGDNPDAKDHPPATDQPQPAAPRAPTSDRAGKTWVVLTALVRIKAQIAAYEETLRKSVYTDATIDYPFYVGYKVHRLEVPYPTYVVQPDDWSKAELIESNTAIQDAELEWGGQMGMTTDVIPPQYVDKFSENLRFPLGPMMNQQHWLTDKHVVHYPEIPLANPNQQWGGGGFGSPMPGQMAPVPGVSGRQGGNAGVGRTRGRPGTAPGGAAPSTPSTEQAKSPEYCLLRFFDFKVKPGKHYVYRVQVLLDNPNYINPQAGRTLRQAYLKDPKLGADPELPTAWSEPSPVVSVPRTARILAVSVEPKRLTVSLAGSAKVKVTKWLQSKGIEAFTEDPLDVERGEMINFRDKEFTPHGDNMNRGMMGGMPMPGGGMPYPGGGMMPGPGGGMPYPGGGMMPGPGGGMMPGPGGGMPYPGGGMMPGPAGGAQGPGGARGHSRPGQGQQPWPGAPTPGAGAPVKVNYLTYSLSVDFRGGERLSKKKDGTHVPGEILLLDAEGNLLVRNEFDDEPICSSLKDTGQTPVVSGPAPPNAQPPQKGPLGNIAPSNQRGHGHH